jgi:type IV pilus assembly protein PilV
MRAPEHIAVQTMRAARASAGFTLAEVLVALFVVALGIAGAAGMQASALRSGREAAHIADGVQLAATLADRMRANPAAMALDDAANPYLRIDTDADADADADGVVPPAVDCFGDNDCSAAELAQLDLAEAAHELAARFPGGRILACRDASAPDASGLPSWSCAGQPGAPVVIKLGWRERDDPAAVPRVLLPVTGGGA